MIAAFGVTDHRFAVHNALTRPLPRLYLEITVTTRDVDGIMVVVSCFDSPRRWQSPRTIQVVSRAGNQNRAGLKKWTRP